MELFSVSSVDLIHFSIIFIPAMFVWPIEATKKIEHQTDLEEF